MTMNQVGSRRVALTGAAGALLLGGLLSAPAPARGADLRAVASASEAAGVDVRAAALRTTGRTSQDARVSATVSNGRTRIVRFVIGVTARCCTSNDLQSTITVQHITVGDGRFSASGPLVISLRDGLRANTRFSTRGRVAGPGTSGTFRLTASVVDVTGQTVDTCRTGTVRFSTRR